jgi:hypothetical protein
MNQKCGERIVASKTSGNFSSRLLKKCWLNERLLLTICEGSRSRMPPPSDDRRPRKTARLPAARSRAARGAGGWLAGPAQSNPML